MPSPRRESARSVKTLKRGVAHGRRRVLDSNRDMEREQRIRKLFLERAESYGLHEGARIIGVSLGVLRREAERDQREAYRSDGVWCFTWRQLAYVAMRR
jgi:hypothetical protein